MAYFDGKRAAVTGAGSGIGRALARALNAEGCAVWLSDIDAEGLAATADSLAREAAPVHTRVVDVADRIAMQRWRDEVAKGGDCLHLLVNNAGVALVAEARDMRMDDLAWLMDINFYGTVHGTQAFLPLLERAPRSHLVNMSSLFGIIGVPTQSAYNASKFAVRGFSDALRQELARDGSPVEVCCVHPGGVATAIAASARSANPGRSAAERAREFRRLARTTPDSAAAQILRAVERGRKRLLLGRDARIATLIATLFPVSYPRLMPMLARAGR
jgi:short-subunit dehydrogenase